MHTVNFFENLVQTLRLVASRPDVQISLLPNFVNVADEIALAYSDSFLTADQIHEDLLISLETLGRLNELNDLFDQMSNDKSLWSIEKLIEDESWEKCRQLASIILETLKVPYQVPNLIFMKWIQ